MKRRRFIAGILVLSMLLMGTGYAYWTDSLKISTIASTGELKVKFMDLSLYGQYGYPDSEKGWSIIDGVNTGATTEDYFFNGNARVNHNIIADPAKLAEYQAILSGYTNTTFNAILEDNPEKLLTAKFGSAYEIGTDLADTIKINLTNMYPGYAQVFQADIANMGSLTAKLSEVKASVNDTVNESTQEMIGIALHVLREYSDTEGPKQGHVNVFDTLAKNTPSIPADAFFTVGGVKFLRVSALPQLYTAIQNDNLFVDPDDNRMDVYFAVAMDPDAVGSFTTGKIVNGAALTSKDDSLTQLETATITVDFLWDQFNVDYTTNATNNLMSTTPAPQSGSGWGWGW